MAKPRSKVLVKAWEGGQAAKRYGAPEDGNPFDPYRQADEHKAWTAGFGAPLEEKWTRPGGRPISQEIAN